MCINGHHVYTFKGYIVNIYIYINHMHIISGLSSLHYPLHLTSSIYLINIYRLAKAVPGAALEGAPGAATQPGGDGRVPAEGAAGHGAHEGAEGLGPRRRGAQAEALGDG